MQVIDDISMWVFERTHAILVNSKLDKLDKHIKKRYEYYLVLMAVIAAFTHYFTVAVNVTTSLPGTLYIVEKNVFPHKGDFASFKYPGYRFYAHDSSFLKIMKGVHGDKVTQKALAGRYTAFYVNGAYVGTAKPLSMHGLPLTPNKSGTIPSGQFYMMGISSDSLDSRYSDVGYIKTENIIGKAVRVF